MTASFHHSKPNKSGIVVSVELRHGQTLSERAERTASRVGGALLFLLAAYVTTAALWHLWQSKGEEFSWPGFIAALVAIPAMRYLALRKIAIAKKIGSRALRADALEAVTWLVVVRGGRQSCCSMAFRRVVN